MTIDEGCIKFRCAWTNVPLPDYAQVEELERWRRPLFEAGLIGEIAGHGIGYGNISIRCGGPGQFLISGTQTGRLASTSAAHYALVTSWDLQRNSVCCVGLVQASSEAMTHAAIYGLDPHIGAVVHVHSSSLWQKYRNRLPITDPGVAYGTPEMANEFRRLYRDTDFREARLAVMGGHPDGLLSYGETLADAATRVLAL